MGNPSANKNEYVTSIGDVVDMSGYTIELMDNLDYQIYNERGMKQTLS